MSPIIAVALAFGVLAGVLTWVAGPSKGIFAVGKAGYLPPFFQKTNANGVQKNILLIQGLAVTLLSLLFVVMPSVQSFYQILSQLTVLLYLIMYLLMFSGAIYLRYNMKKAPRPFRIGSKGNGLMWLIGGLGFCGSLLAFVLSFIPPQPDCGRQQHRMVCRFDYRLRRGSRSSVHYLCIAQTVMGRQEHTVRTVPLGSTGYNGTDSGSGFRRG